MATGSVMAGKAIVLEARLKYRAEDVKKLPDRYNYSDVVPSLVFLEDALDGWTPDLTKVRATPTRIRVDHDNQDVRFTFTFPEEFFEGASDARTGAVFECLLTFAAADVQAVPMQEDGVAKRTSHRAGKVAVTRPVPARRPVNVAFTTQNDDRGSPITMRRSFREAAQQLVGTSGVILPGGTIQVATQSIRTRFPATGADRVGKVFFVGHGDNPQYYFGGRTPANASDLFDFDVHPGQGNNELLWSVPPLTPESIAFLKELEASLMPSTDGFVVELGFICCYAGTELVNAVAAALNADNSTGSDMKRYKVRVGGYKHKLDFRSTDGKDHNNALQKVVLAKEVPPDEYNPDPLALITTTWIDNSADLSVPPPYDVEQTTN